MYNKFLLIILTHAKLPMSHPMVTTAGACCSTRTACTRCWYTRARRCRATTGPTSTAGRTAAGSSSTTSPWRTRRGRSCGARAPAAAAVPVAACATRAPTAWCTSTAGATTSSKVTPHVHPARPVSCLLSPFSLTYTDSRWDSYRSTSVVAQPSQSDIFRSVRQRSTSTTCLC